MIDAIVGGFRNIRADMCDPGKMHDRIHAADQWGPVDRRRQIGQRRNLDARGKTLRAPLAHRRTDRVPGAVKRGDKRAPDKTRRAGHQNAAFVRRHRLLRANVINSHATSAPPSASVARSTRGSGSIALTMASPASARLSTNTRTTISRTEKPLLVAR